MDLLRMRRIKNVGCGFNAFVKLLCGYPFWSVIVNTIFIHFTKFLVLFEIGITDKLRFSLLCLLTIMGLCDM